MANTQMEDVALFGADDVLYKGSSIFPLYEAFSAEGLIDSDELELFREICARYEQGDSNLSFVNVLSVAATILNEKKVEGAEKIAKDFFANPEFPWYEYVKPVKAAFDKAGVVTELISPLPRLAVDGICSALGIKRGANHVASLSSRFGTNEAGTLFSGAVSLAIVSSPETALADQKPEMGLPPIVDIANLKLQLVNGSERFSPPNRSFAFGSNGDASILEAVGQPIVINPNDQLRARAHRSKWNIVDPHDPGSVLSLLTGLEPN